jgi:hypothetical protein
VLRFWVAALGFRVRFRLVNATYMVLLRVACKGVKKEEKDAETFNPEP